MLPGGLVVTEPDSTLILKILVPVANAATVHFIFGWLIGVFDLHLFHVLLVLL